MSGIRKYPKGATHCVDPNHMFDEGFYRIHKSGEYLEFFAMGRHEWFRSTLVVDHINTLHKLEDPDQLVG